jgi:Acetyltransferase (GNAT) family
MSNTTNDPPSTSMTTTIISHLPRVTVSSSREYAIRLIEHVARSFINSPIVISIVAEVDDIEQPPFAPLTHERRAKHFESGSILPAAENGALIADADDWTAASLWEPPGFRCGMASPRYQNPLPVLKEFMAKAAAVREKHLGPEDQQRYWHLSYLARDPSRTGKGAVFAVMRPFLERAKEDGAPAWLEAIGLHAVRVYEHYGFTICEKMTVGEGRARADGWPEENGEGFAVWAMIFDEHVRA